MEYQPPARPGAVTFYIWPRVLLHAGGALSDRHKMVQVEFRADQSRGPDVEVIRAAVRPFLTSVVQQGASPQSLVHGVSEALRRARCHKYRVQIMSAAIYDADNVGETNLLNYNIRWESDPLCDFGWLNLKIIVFD